MAVLVPNDLGASTACGYGLPSPTHAHRLTGDTTHCVTSDTAQPSHRRKNWLNRAMAPCSQLLMPTLCSTWGFKCSVSSCYTWGGSGKWVDGWTALVGGWMWHGWK